MKKEDFAKLKLAVIAKSIKDIVEINDIFHLAGYKHNSEYPTFEYMKGYIDSGGVQIGTNPSSNLLYHQLEWNPNDEWYGRNGWKVLTLSELKTLARKYGIRQGKPSKFVRRLDWGQLKESKNNIEEFKKLKLAIIARSIADVVEINDVYKSIGVNSNNEYPNFSYMEYEIGRNGVQIANWSPNQLEWNRNNDFYERYKFKKITMTEFRNLARQYGLIKGTNNKNVRRINWGKMNEADKASFRLPDNTVVCFENIKEALEASEIMQKADYHVFSPEDIERYYSAVQRNGEGKFCINFIRRQYSGDSFYKEIGYNIISLRELKKLATPYGIVPSESRNIRRLNWGKLKESKFLNNIDKYLNEHLMNEKYDMETLKKKLPRVRVNFDGEEHTGYMKVGDTDFAYVHLDDLPGTKFKYDWETILDAVNNGTVLET